MRGLPNVFAVGYVGREAIYHKVNEKGGFINFSMYCMKDDARRGDPNPSCWYNVSLWVKEGSKLPAFLTKGTPIQVTGMWEVTKDYAKNISYHKLVASKLNLLSVPKEAPTEEVSPE